MIDPLLQEILFDPQTSGGLLIGIQDKFSQDLLQELKSSGAGDSAIIGEVTSGSAVKIMVD